MPDNYDPNEPRDKNGKWTDSGGGGEGPEERRKRKYGNMSDWRDKRKAALAGDKPAEPPAEPEKPSEPASEPTSHEEQPAQEGETQTGSQAFKGYISYHQKGGKTKNDQRDSDDPEMKEVIDRVHQALDRHSPQVTKHLQGLNVCSTPDAFWEQYASDFGYDHAEDAKKRGVVGYFNPRYNTVTLMSTGAGMRSVLDHEMGHVAHHHSKNWMDWVHIHKKDATFDRHTWYSRTNVKEAFAETYMAYVQAKQRGAPSGPRTRTWKSFQVLEQVLEGMR